MGVLEPCVAQLVEEEALPVLFIVVGGWVIGLAGRTRPFEMLAVAVWTFLPQLAHLVDDACLQLGDAIVELGLVAAWSRPSLAHRKEIIIIPSNNDKANVE